MAQLTVHNYIVRELLYKFIRCILPIRVANNIGVFVPAYTACVKFRVDTINHRSLAQWNIFIHHNSGFLSMNPEEGLNISLYLQNTLIFRLTVERQLAAGLNAGVSQQTNSIHYGKPKRQHARPTNAVSTDPWEVSPNRRLRNKFRPNVPSDFTPMGNPATNPGSPGEQRWYTFTCRGCRVP